MFSFNYFTFAVCSIGISNDLNEINSPTSVAPDRIDFSSRTKIYKQTKLSF